MQLSVSARASLALVAGFLVLTVMAACGGTTPITERGMLAAAGLAAASLTLLTFLGLLWRRLFVASARQSARALVTAHEETFDEAVQRVLERNVPWVRTYMLRADMFGKENADRTEAAAIARATAARVESMAENFGDLPNTMRRLADSFDRHELTFEKFMGETKKRHEEFGGDMRRQAVEFAEFRGEVRAAWDGQDRRRGDRRHEDGT